MTTDVVSLEQQWQLYDLLQPYISEDEFKVLYDSNALMALEQSVDVRRLIQRLESREGLASRSSSSVVTGKGHDIRVSGQARPFDAETFAKLIIEIAKEMPKNKDEAA